jgi:A/G-specific adenine glycosylase
MNSSFTALLMHWNRMENDRRMPWKGEKDPYRIWLSEIILQQTRVEQGRAYYERFISQYPTIRDLALAPEKEVFKLWEGLGYYSRCRNLIHTAKTIMQEFGGKFPDSYPQILSLKGIGRYTAAAIASFAFGLPYAVVDGNVIRVLSRLAGIESPVDLPATRKAINQLADAFLDRKNPGTYNQAMMDFGATVCKPQQPLCVRCPMQEICVAFRQGRTNLIPVKLAKPEKKQRWFYYLLLESRGRVLVRERTGSDIWKNLHELVLVESPEELAPKAIAKHPQFSPWLPADALDDALLSDPRSQLLTHQRIRGRFLHLRLRGSLPEKPETYRWVSRKELGQLAFPKYILAYLQEIGYHA